MVSIVEYNVILFYRCNYLPSTGETTPRGLLNKRVLTDQLINPNYFTG
jgi:hypothetical protein